MKYFKLVIVLLFFCIVGCPKHKKINPVKMSFLACGDADITLIQNDVFTLLIDTGESNCSKEAIHYLEKNITEIDLMILTHPDKDHIGNAVSIIKRWKPKKIYASNYRKYSDVEKELLEFVEENQIDYEIVLEDKHIKIDSMDIFIEGPKQNYDSSNNSSLITYVKVGDIRTFFGADIKKKRIEEINALNSEIVKLPYHGRYLSNLEQLLKQLNPEYVIITSENPDKKTIQVLEKMDIKYDLTKQNIVIEVDGTSWKIASNT